MNRRVEIFQIDSRIEGHNYFGYGLILSDYDGSRSFEGFALSRSDLGDSILVMELQKTSEGVIPKKVKTVFPIDNNNFRTSLRAAEKYTQIISISRANVFLGDKREFNNSHIIFESLGNL